MNIFTLVLRKFKAFRMPLFSIVLTAFATYRSFTTGNSIQLGVICAAIMPFFCQFMKFPTLEDVKPLQDVMASMVFNLILSAIYLGWVLGWGWLGRTFNPNYTPHPCMQEMILFGIAADVVFICATVPICHKLEPMQRLIPGIALTSGMLEYMKIVESYVAACNPTNVLPSVLKFSISALMTCFVLIFIAYRERKSKCL